MTAMKDILDLMLILIPEEYKTNLDKDENLAKFGCIEMLVAIGEDGEFSETTEVITNDDGEQETIYHVFLDKDLSLSKKRLASYYTYLAYLMRLKDALNQEAINFKTLTFEIKGLEKRPEQINDSIYTLNRYIDKEVAKVTQTNAVIGKIYQFGGSNT